MRSLAVLGGGSLASLFVCKALFNDSSVAVFLQLVFFAAVWGGCSFGLDKILKGESSLSGFRLATLPNDARGAWSTPIVRVLLVEYSVFAIMVICHRLANSYVKNHSDYFSEFYQGWEWIYTLVGVYLVGYFVMIPLRIFVGGGSIEGFFFRINKYVGQGIQAIAVLLAVLVILSAAVVSMGGGGGLVTLLAGGLVAVLMAASFRFNWLRGLEHKKRAAQRQEITQAYGVKGWADLELIKRALKHQTSGIYIGGGHTWNDKGHILTVGGSRSGKGANLILPNLLSYTFTRTGASIVALDPKGENLAIAGDFLKSQGYEIYCINPFNIKAVARFGNARFNPLLLTDITKPSQLCDMLADAMLPPSGGRDSHFEESGSQYLSNYMLHMLTKYPDDLSFETLYSWVRLAGERRLSFLAEMAENKAARSVSENAMAISDQIADGGNEINSIYSTMRRGTEFLKEDGIIECLSGNDIDFRQIPFKKMAIFLCMEPTELEKYKEFVRLFFATLMNTLPKVTDKERKILFLMDEFIQMGRLREFEIGADVLAGYNITIWSIIQYLGQLDDVYGKRGDGFLGNAVVKQFLGIGDLKTAEYLSKIMPIDLHFWQNPDGTLGHTTRSMLSESDVIYFDEIICQVRGLDRPARFKFRPYYEMPIGEHASKF